MSKVRIGVVGAGLIAQVEHIPNLITLNERFDLIGVADPSPKARKQLEHRHSVSTCQSFDELLRLQPEAVLVAAPDSYHAEFASRALRAGAHVFCEKPLSFSVADIDQLIADRDASGRVLQVGYMKRFDPSYEMLVDEVKDLGPKLRYIAVEVNDPDSWPFSVHQGFQRPDDVPAPLIAENRHRLQQQVENVMQTAADNSLIRGYADSFASSMIHDLNVFHGLMDAMGITDVKPINGRIFAGGQATAAMLAIGGSQALCQLSHVVVPKLADYQERLSIFFDDRRFELIFPSPYLNHFQTRLICYRSEGMKLSVTEHRNGFEEAFVRELIGFRDAIVKGTPVRNSAEDARKDIALVEALGCLAVTGRLQHVESRVIRPSMSIA